MPTRFIVLLSLVIGATVIGPACRAQPASTEASAAPARTETPTLQSYERIRSLLANDELKDVRQAALDLEKAATAQGLTAVATAATKLAEAPADPDAVRVSFGVVSEAVVAVVAAQPELQKGRAIFECPMAQGYKKWVQAAGTINNPYMGQRMLGCGAPSTWTP